MPKQPELRPFTYTISNMLLAVVVVYFLSNLGVIFTCAGSGIHACTFLSPLPSFDFVPAISKPVNFLIAMGNPDRAAFVLGIYSFAWFTGLIALAIMIALTALISLRTTEAERLQTKEFLDRAAEENANAAAATMSSPASGVRYSKDDFAHMGFGIFVAVTGVALLFVFYGFYSFHGWSAVSNMVHVRDRDFYMMTIGWSFLLLFSIFFLCFAVRRLLLPSSPAAKKPRL